MTPYEQTLNELRGQPRRWLVTGVAGFIGSNLLESLLAANQRVTGLDNLTTGKRANVELALRAVEAGAAKRFEFIEGDIRSADTCRRACQNVDVVLHHAAQVSVPASLEEPLVTHEVNATGFLNVLMAARQTGVRRVVYASSCAVYGDSPNLPLTEEEPVRPLSPYASSKLANEGYAAAFANTSGPEAVGLRYFNVFGSRQDPKGVYAAVIPQWIFAMLQGQAVRVFGDGSTTRDFCPVSNVVQANILAALAPLSASRHEVVNVAVGMRTSLTELFEAIRAKLQPTYPQLREVQPLYEPFRPGEIRHSHAQIAKARQLLGYAPTHSVEQGLEETVAWFVRSMESHRR
jgi:UDP-N-acetylglucosamine 4-epimerase